MAGLLDLLSPNMGRFPYKVEGNDPISTRQRPQEASETEEGGAANAIIRKMFGLDKPVGNSLVQRMFDPYVNYLKAVGDALPGEDTPPPSRGAGFQGSMAPFAGMSPLESAAAEIGVPQPRKDAGPPSPRGPQAPSSAGVAQLAQMPQAPAGRDMAPYIQLLRDQMNRPAPEVTGFLPPREKAPTFDQVMQSGENMGPLLLAFAQGLAQPNTPFVTAFANALGGVGKTVQGIRGEKSKEISETRKEQLEEFQQAVARARMQQDQQRNQASLAGDIAKVAEGQDARDISRFQANTTAQHYADQATMTPARINVYNAQAEAARSLAAQRNETSTEEKLPAADRIVLQGVVSRWQAMQKRLDEDTTMSPADRIKAELRLKEQLKGILKATGKEHLMPQLNLYAAVPEFKPPPRPGE